MTDLKLFEKEIDDVCFEVRTSSQHKVSCLCVDGEPFWVQDVDLAQVIRAVATSERIWDLRTAVEGIWGDDKLIRILNCHTLLFGGL